LGGYSSMVEPQIVVLDVAGSSPVGHPTFTFFPGSGNGCCPRVFLVAGHFYSVGSSALDCLDLFGTLRAVRLGLASVSSKYVGEVCQFSSLIPTRLLAARFEAGHGINVGQELLDDFLDGYFLRAGVEVGDEAVAEDLAGDGFYALVIG